MGKLRIPHIIGMVLAAFVTVAHELGNDRALHDGAALLSGFACDLSPCHLGVGTDDARTGRHLEAVFIGDRRKIRRHFEIGTRIGRKYASPASTSDQKVS